MVSDMIVDEFMTARDSAFCKHHTHRGSRLKAFGVATEDSSKRHRGKTKEPQRFAGGEPPESSGAYSMTDATVRRTEAGGVIGFAG